jgi:hypothetical protein
MSAGGNPNHPVVRQLETEWHKLLAVALHKLGLSELEITHADVEGFASSELTNIVADCRNHRFVLRLCDDTTAAELSRHEGGRPF